MKIAPSLLSADYTNLLRQIGLAEKGGADMFHIDIMDGHFVPNITVGPVIVQAVRRCTKLPLDVHLMIDNPGKMVKSFADAGADYITVHLEAEGDVGKTIDLIKKQKKSAGIVMNPATPFEKSTEYLSQVDMMLIMTVVPGFAGQRFMPEVLPKIKQASEYISKKGLSVELEVDGGINMETVGPVAAAGADIIVAGTAIFGGRIGARIAKRMRGRTIPTK